MTIYNHFFIIVEKHFELVKGLNCRFQCAHQRLRFGLHLCNQLLRPEHLTEHYGKPALKTSQKFDSRNNISRHPANFIS